MSSANQYSGSTALGNGFYGTSYNTATYAPSASVAKSSSAEQHGKSVTHFVIAVCILAALGYGGYRLIKYLLDKGNTSTSSSSTASPDATSGLGKTGKIVVSAGSVGGFAWLVLAIYYARSLAPPNADLASKVAGGMIFPFVFMAKLVYYPFWTIGFFVKTVVWGILDVFSGRKGVPRASRLTQFKEGTRKNFKTLFHRDVARDFGNILEKFQKIVANSKRNDGETVAEEADELAEHMLNVFSLTRSGELKEDKASTPSKNLKAGVSMFNSTVLKSLGSKLTGDFENLETKTANIEKVLTAKSEADLKEVSGIISKAKSYLADLQKETGKDASLNDEMYKKIAEYLQERVKVVDGKLVSKKTERDLTGGKETNAVRNAYLRAIEM